MITQEFNGKIFTLYKGEKYLSRGGKRMHVYVWETVNKRKVPIGYHVHHKDEDTLNNEPDNLGLKEVSEHQSYHALLTHQRDKEYSKRFQQGGTEKAKAWHSTDAGKKWHSKHAKDQWNKKPFIEKVCIQCGVTYKTKHPKTSKFCHQNCKARALRARRKATV